MYLVMHILCINSNLITDLNMLPADSTVLIPKTGGKENGLK